MKTELNTRQMAFCRNYVQGASGSEAYRRAGYSPRRADAGAAQILKNPNIQAEVDRLRNAAEDEAILTVIERKILLSNVARGTVPGDIIRAIHELNEMENVYEQAANELPTGNGVSIIMHPPRKTNLE